MPPAMPSVGEKPAISVIVCTHNRRELLKMNLESLESQTLYKSRFEVVLVDDGSTDGTAALADAFRGRLPLRYFYQESSGLCTARNHGLLASRGDIVFFFDDDDTATPGLLEGHLDMHRLHPGENFAVLNHTAWHPGLEVTPLMHYITEVGCFLFSYPNISPGEVLDYTCFWGGRVSCKRSLLLRHGIFRADMKIHYEDIELAYRLSRKAGLKVVYSAGAVSHMARPVSFDDFCLRMVLQGRSACLFARVHRTPEVRRYCEVEGAPARWNKIAPEYYAKVRAARELDRLATIRAGRGMGLDGGARRLLYEAYQWAFRASKLKGIMEAWPSAAPGGRDL